MARRALALALPALALVLFAGATYWSLLVAPPDRQMGDVYRIIYVHVPSAWVALLAYTVTFAAAIVFLVKEHPAADAVAEASAEIGVIFNGLLLVTGSIWGKPTWGVWWSWDPRLTTAAIMLFAFLGYLALRRFVDVPEKRATWSAVVAIIVYADIPIVWFSVRWWNSLHQTQSSKDTLSPEIAWALLANAVAFMVLYAWLLRVRYGIARRRALLDVAEPPEVARSAVGEEP